jgi:hypothetical protein
MTPEQEKWATNYIGKLIKVPRTGEESPAVSFVEGKKKRGAWFTLENRRMVYKVWPQERKRK